MKKITAVLIGAGQRGLDAYGPYALQYPNEFQIIAVADPMEERRKEAQRLHQIKSEYCFADWKELLAKEKLADAALICTQDRMHFEPTVKALEGGYHVLLEKPMSNNPKECIWMGEYAKKYNRAFTICHVLRYTPFYTAIKEILDSGKIGTVVSMQQIENVAYWHQSHSFVRGNWRNSKESSPMILQKSCHDMDIILWLMESKCKKISSFGSLMHFNEKNAPKGAPKRCLDGCGHRDECPYYVADIYLNGENSKAPEELKRVVSNDTSMEGLIKALETGPYGRCVYHCDNDVVDHQVVNMEFENGSTASFTMCAFTANGGRTLKIMGTKGQIMADFEQNKIETETFLAGNKELIIVNTSVNGHGGGDMQIMKGFLAQIRSEGTYKGKSSAETSVESHLMALAAEESRLTGKMIDLEEFLKNGCKE